MKCLNISTRSDIYYKQQATNTPEMSGTVWDVLSDDGEVSHCDASEHGATVSVGTMANSEPLRHVVEIKSKTVRMRVPACRWVVEHGYCRREGKGCDYDHDAARKKIADIPCRAEAMHGHCGYPQGGCYFRHDALRLWEIQCPRERDSVRRTCCPPEGKRCFYAHDHARHVVYADSEMPCMRMWVLVEDGDPHVRDSWQRVERETDPKTGKFRTTRREFEQFGNCVMRGCRFGHHDVHVKREALRVSRSHV